MPFQQRYPTNYSFQKRNKHRAGNQQLYRLFKTTSKNRVTWMTGMGKWVLSLSLFLSCLKQLNYYNIWCTRLHLEPAADLDCSSTGRYNLWYIHVTPSLCDLHEISLSFQVQFNMLAITYMLYMSEDTWGIACLQWFLPTLLDLAEWACSRSLLWNSTILYGLIYIYLSFLQWLLSCFSPNIWMALMQLAFWKSLKSWSSLRF